MRKLWGLKVAELYLGRVKTNITNAEYDSAFVIQL
jgi:hypothetical protein